MIRNLKQRQNMKKKGVLIILNATQNYILDFYVNHKTIYKLIKNYQPQRLDKVLSTQNSKSVAKMNIIIIKQKIFSIRTKRNYC